MPIREEASKFYHVANQAYAEGKIKKAIKNLKKAIELDPTNEKFINGLAGIYHKEGKYKKALKYISKRRHLIQDSIPERTIQMLNWEGCYALSNDLPKTAILRFQRGIRDMEKYGVVDSLLSSHLYCNWGVAELYDQGLTQPCNEHLLGGCHKIHITDVQRAIPRFEEAIAIHPYQCNKEALWNLALTKRILEVSKDTLLEYKGYIPNTFVQDIKVSEQDTLCPELPTEVLIEEDEEKLDVTVFNNVSYYDEVLYVMDISGSMSVPVSRETKKTRFQVMIKMIMNQIDKAKAKQKIGLLTIGGECFNSPWLSINVRSVDSLNRINLRNRLNELSPNGGTPLFSTLEIAPTLFSTEEKKKRIIYLASDGLEGCYQYKSVCQLAEELCNQGIKIEVFSLLLDQRSHLNEYGLYQCISNVCEGELYGISEDGKMQLMEESIPIDFQSLLVVKEDLIKGVFQPMVD